jgi:16S rRNA processing protein RimM
VLADSFTDFPERFAQREGLFLRPPAGGPPAMREAKVEANWLPQGRASGRVVLKLAQVDSITQAEALRGFEVVVRQEARIPLEGDAVYVSDLLGMRVTDVRQGGSQFAGEIIDVEPEGVGPAMLVVRTPDEHEVMIPFVRAYLRKVDTVGKQIEMDLPEGLVAMQAAATEQERLAAPPAEDKPE